jgi:hypothetical protein
MGRSYRPICDSRASVWKLEAVLLLDCCALLLFLLPLKLLAISNPCDNLLPVDAAAPPSAAPAAPAPLDKSGSAALAAPAIAVIIKHRILLFLVTVFT